MSPERAIKTESLSLSVEQIRVNDGPLIEMIIERGLPFEVETRPLLDLTNDLRILSYSALLKTTDCEQVANSLGLEFQRDRFDQSLEIFYHLFEIEDYHSRYNRKINLLKEAMKHDVIPPFPL